MNKEWHAIDLHLHTVPGYTGNGQLEKGSPNFTYFGFVHQLKTHSIELAATTNHNIVSLSNYCLCRYLGKLFNCNVLFGAELDTDREVDGKDMHFVIVFDINSKKSSLRDLPLCVELSSKINKATEQKRKDGKIRFSAGEILELLRNYDCLLIPHGDKAKGALENPTEEVIISALKKVREGFIRVFDSPSNWRLQEIKEFIEGKNYVGSIDEFGGVLFSDNKDWNNYNLKHFYMHAEPTYKGFLHSVSNPTQRFNKKDFIKSGNNYIRRIKITKRDNCTDRIADCDLLLHSGYNCIIGKSGSGKSLLLYAIKKVLGKISSEDANYAFLNDYDIQLFNEDGNEITPNNINVGVGENIFKLLMTSDKAEGSDDKYQIVRLFKNDFKKRSKFNSFVNNYRKRLKEFASLKTNEREEDKALSSSFVTIVNNISELSKLSEIKTFQFEVPEDIRQEYSDVDFQSIQTLTKSILDIRKILGLIKNKELQSKALEELNLFGETIKQIITIASKNRLDTRIKNLRRKVCRNVLSGINAANSQNAKRKTDLLTGMDGKISAFAKDAAARYLTKLKIANFDLSVNLGELNDLNKTIDVDNKVTISEEIDIPNFLKVNERTNAIFATRGIQKFLSNAIEYDLTKADEARALLTKYFDNGKLGEKDIDAAFEQVTPTLKIYFDGQDIEKLNPGDIAKKSIKSYFDKELANGTNSVILYDQIENDVDKEFISGTIKELISKIKDKAQIIIVTHDPIVAVNADPTNYIQASKTGNKISYRNFCPESELKDELSTIANTVDGSKQVIRDRYEIYREGK